MDRKKKIEQEIAKTLEEFDKVERLPEDPYFYTRMQARLNSREKKNALFPRVLRPAIVTLLLLLNIGTAYFYLNTGTSGQTTTQHQELGQTIAEELGMQQSENITFIF